MSNEKRLRIADIKVDQSLQARESDRPDIVDEYAEAKKAGQKFPPIDVFKVGSDYWLVDGFRRIAADKKLKKMETECIVHFGSMEQALIFSVGANHAHGLRRTVEDKRKAVRMLIANDKWAGFANRMVADACNVSHTLVADVRKEIEESAKTNPEKPGESTGGTAGSKPEPKTRVGKDGKARKVNVKPVKKKPKPKNGSPLFAYKEFLDDFGRIVRQVNKFGEAYKCKDTPTAEGLYTNLNVFKETFDQWFENMTGSKPPQ